MACWPSSPTASPRWLRSRGRCSSAGRPSPRRKQADRCAESCARVYSASRMTHISVGGPPRELLADRAYEQLRDQIVTLRIPPCAPIDEDLIGQQLEMGRTPVREAIKRLALENLVVVY